MDTLDIVIIVCVIIGALALCFVFYILYWAWQYDRRNRDQFRADGAKDNGTPAKEGAMVQTGSNDDVSSFGAPAGGGAAEEKKIGNNATSSTEDMKQVYPSEIGLDDSLYPESVMSEDVNSSIRNSDHMGAGYLPNSPASVSSMDVESYGYSIEAHSLATRENTEVGSSASKQVKSQDSLLGSKDGRPPSPDDTPGSYY
mmetsp:Transcript_26594/g.73391  ORF Transcript_26594/g.73391 Transcript_26594/m.73391 type:complete len:199 (+) Transcript_26594:135-731(+)|eukprot:CAMPEP_0168803352 /NCGR_PEP_ID=MMETSP0725-20121227/20552_1 /TAXON_ID=265536 /ORGANISM="Amphiprora sp., Strain CCMP467" /LENGTH=198 /DNA_ID=CAMNT_0008855147 /DNA_START=49 /DNA_END=645 /DNA_ORIENTATION=+